MALSLGIPILLGPKDRIRVCDPTQHFDNLHCKEFKLLPGKYTDYIHIEDLGAYGERPVEVQFILDGTDVELNESLGIICIESAHAYMGLSSAYSANIRRIIDDINKNIPNNGALTPHIIDEKYIGLSFISGMGDGSYRCMGGRDEAGNLVAIAFVLDEFAQRSSSQEMREHLKLSFGFTDEEIEKMFKVNSNFLRYDIGDIDQVYFQLTRRFPLSKADVKKIASENAWLLTEDLLRFVFLKKHYRSIGLDRNPVFFRNHPTALSINPKNAENLITKFRSEGRTDEEIRNIFLAEFETYFSI